MSLRGVVWSTALTALALLVLPKVAAGQGTVRVAVVESTVNKLTRYTYRVENRTSQPIVGLQVGFDRAADQPQLHDSPLGWTFEAGVPPTSAGAPRGWTFRVITTEESDLIFLDWSSDGDPQWDIAPGATAGGFSVTLARPSAEYRTARFEVILGNSALVTGTLVPG